MKKAIVWLVAMLLPLMLVACGGGGGGSSSGGGGGTTAATALTVASKVSVVDAQLTNSVASGAAPLKIGWASILKAFSRVPASTTDFYTDKTQVWVNERSVDSLDNVNNILCMVGQTKYDAMLNKPTYIALVDQNLCSSDKSNASTAGQDSQNQSSGATMPNYMKFVVNSSRIDDNHDEIVKAWVHDKNGPNNQPQLIFAHIVISEGTSTTNPYGIFTLNFMGYPQDSNGSLIGYPDTPIFKGTLRAVRINNKVVLQFVQNESYQDGYCGNVNTQRAITLDKVAGAGHVKDIRISDQNTSDPQCNGTTEFGIAYNDTDFYREDLVSSLVSCLSRTAFEESAWSYGLYDSSGARVNRNSGFPITFTQGVTQHQGWVGYWGLWTDGTVTLNSGDTVNKVDYNNGSQTPVPYTVFKSDGKLKKHTKHLLTLNNIKNIPLNYSEWSGSTGTNYQVVWDGTNFNKTAYMPQNCNGNCYWTNITTTPTPTIDLSNLLWGNLNFWSDSLGGQAQVQLVSCTTPTCGMNGCITSCSFPLPTDQSVIFYAEDLVYPTDTIPATLACYDNCPQVDGNGEAYTSMSSGSSNTATIYGFDTATMLLMTTGTATVPVIMTALTTTNPWGVMSGALFDPTSANMALLDCNWDRDNDPATNPQICGWKAWSALPEFYTWETGPNNWNQFIALRTSPTGSFVKFDPPLQVKYVGLGDPYGSSGTTFMLDYGGFGQLNGIPGKCVDLDTGADADCSQSQNSQSIRWVPQFTIPSAIGTTLTQLTDSSDNTTQYYVKPLQVEQRMKTDTSAGACSFAPADFSAYTLPSITDPGMWDNPVQADGLEPSVTDAPAVIGGVVQ